MEWGQIEDATRRVFASILQLAPHAIRFTDESGGSVFDSTPHLEIMISDVDAIGQDEERFEEAEGAGADRDDQTVLICGPRMFTMSIAAESLATDVRNPRGALNLITTLQTRIGRTTTIEALAPYYAISTYEKIRRVPYRDAEDRLISRYVLDLHCLTADNDIDRTVGAGGWIGEVIGTGTVTAAGRSGDVAIPVPMDVKET